MTKKFEIPGYKIKRLPEYNYCGIFDRETQKTMRIPMGGREILPLPYPEILDVSLGSKCNTECPWCYTSAKLNGKFAQNVIDKIDKWFGSMTPNQRPIQIAIGGGGEPVIHPEFVNVLDKFASLDILPNYTSNGIKVTDEILEACRRNRSGVALSCHPHLEKSWRKAVLKYFEAGIRTNLHIIVGENGSTERLKKIYKEFKNKVDYFVILPYQASGRAKLIDTTNELHETFKFMQHLETNQFIKFKKFLRKLLKKDRGLFGQIAVGALFHPFILENHSKYPNVNLGIYEPEILSGYCRMDEDEFLIRKSSYDLRPKFINGKFNK